MPQAFLYMAPPKGQWPREPLAGGATQRLLGQFLTQVSLHILSSSFSASLMIRLSQPPSVAAMFSDSSV